MSPIRTRPVDYKLRLTEDMHQWLKASAEKNYRTMMAEINMHLDHARERIENQSGIKKADVTVESNSSASVETNKESK